MTKRMDELEFAAIVAREQGGSPYYVASLCDDLIRLSKLHRTACERYCNEEGFVPATIERREALIVRALEGSGIGVTFQHDPRGATVKLIVPSGFTNDWGKEGVCVPTA